MKKLLILTLIFIFCLCGCKGKNTNTQDVMAPVTINLPKDNTVNGYRHSTNDKNNMPDTIKGEETIVVSGNSKGDTVSTEYCGNKNSKVFHKSSCESVSTMKETNKAYFGSREEFISNGYKPCARCKP